jgi:type I restriction enzyme R subunit
MDINAVERTIPQSVDTTEINKFLFNADTVDKVLEHLMTHGIKVDGGDRLGKTIIFAKNSRHAKFITERFDANYPHCKGAFARQIDYSVDYVDSLIDDFSDAQKAPHIAVSVDMLDTGIDVPEVVNLVFFKIVRSKTKFWQMIGRGTRLCPDLFAPGEDKARFLVFDFCQNFEFFNQNPNVIDGAVGEAIGKRLFTARVDLIAQFGEAEADHGALAEDLRDRLHAEVAGMNLDNFMVRRKRRHVERFQDREAWASLDLADRDALSSEVAGLPSAFVDDDLAAKQFDLLILTAQLALLRGEAGFAKAMAKIRAIASELEALDNIPIVAKQIELILELQTDVFWTDVTPEMLEAVRRALRGLVQLIEPKNRKIVYTDFEDEIGDGEAVTLGAVGPGLDKGRFKQKVRQFLDAHRDHISLQKLRRAEQLTRQDIEELERIFVEQGVGDAARLAELRQEGGLGIFLRPLIGLDREAAKAAFSDLEELGAMTASQTEFMNLVIDHLTEQGALDPARFYQSPFTDIDAKGIAGVFAPTQIQRIIQAVERLQGTATA